MAKKSTTLRVHQIAKGLGVTSKDVVAKCVEEGVPNITNHMSAISVGLAATITEWFGSSHGDGGTAVQTAAPVNVEAARAKAKKKATRRKAKPVKPVDPKPAESVVVAEPPKPAPDAGPPVAVRV